MGVGRGGVPWEGVCAGVTGREGGLCTAACHELAGGRWLCGDWTNGRAGCSSSGANHCLLVSFPLLSELLSRTAPTGRKEEGEEGVGVGGGRGGSRGLCVCVDVCVWCVQWEPEVQQAVEELLGFRRDKW